MKKIKNLDDFRKVKESAVRSMRARQMNETRVIVGMGACGIAAGARGVMAAILDEVSLHDLYDVSVLQTGCMGKCKDEPLVEIIRPGEPRLTYKNVKPADVPSIVEEHLTGWRK
ncbi:MAG: (2Fe-2S) ferredoxin domain-containing protein [Synergistaceae bacterium]|nr:(2Fe-2S) ferredoxin domain-containing protein [Synergistaceae bacterium]